jgi:hypothetical protein
MDHLTDLAYALTLQRFSEVAALLDEEKGDRKLFLAEFRQFRIRLTELRKLHLTQVAV